MNREYKLAGFASSITIGYTFLICVQRAEKLTNMIPQGHVHPYRIKHSLSGASHRGPLVLRVFGHKFILDSESIGGIISRINEP